MAYRNDNGLVQDIKTTAVVSSDLFGSKVC